MRLLTCALWLIVAVLDWQELHAWPKSINAWKRALGTLPEGDLTPQQEELKKQYQEGLELAQATLKKQEEAPPEVQALPSISERPWNRALKMEDVLTRTSVLNTSVSLMTTCMRLTSDLIVNSGVADYERIQGRLTSDRTHHIDEHVPGFFGRRRLHEAAQESRWQSARES